MTESALAIETRGLRRTFKGGVEAVRGIDLLIAPGEVFGFLGPNGAGKTTTVRILCTLLPPSGGSALVSGVDVVAEFPTVVGALMRPDHPLAGRKTLTLTECVQKLPPDDSDYRALATPYSSTLRPSLSFSSCVLTVPYSGMQFFVCQNVFPSTTAYALCQF